MSHAIVFETTLGLCGFSWETDAVAVFSLPQASPEALERRLKAPLATQPPAWVQRLVERVQRHLNGDVDDFADVALDLTAVSAFDQSVYAALRKVAPGSTTTYGGLAQAIGDAGAARAIGRSMATNPLPLLIPCHRVLPATGELGGFSAYGGDVTKQRLLAIEGVRRLVQVDLFTASETAAAPRRS